MYAHCPFYLPKKVTEKPSVNHIGSSMSHQQSVSYEKPYSMQFSVATCESCTLDCVLLDCNGTKYTGNALSIPAVACSQQLLRRNKLPTGCYFFACLVFSPHDMNVFCDRFDCKQCYDSHAGILKWNFDDSLLRNV